MVLRLIQRFGAFPASQVVCWETCARRHSQQDRREVRESAEENYKTRVCKLRKQPGKLGKPRG